MNKKENQGLEDTKTINNRMEVYKQQFLHIIK